MTHCMHISHSYFVIDLVEDCLFVDYDTLFYMHSVAMHMAGSRIHFTSGHSLA